MGRRPHDATSARDGVMTDQAPAGEVGPTCTCDLLHDRAALAPLPLHMGRGHVEGLSGRVEGDVEFLVPVGGPAVIALCQRHADFLGLLSLERAHVSGESEVVRTWPRRDHGAAAARPPRIEITRPAVAAPRQRKTLAATCRASSSHPGMGHLPGGGPTRPHVILAGRQ